MSYVRAGVHAARIDVSSTVSPPTGAVWNTVERNMNDIRWRYRIFTCPQRLFEVTVFSMTRGYAGAKLPLAIAGIPDGCRRYPPISHDKEYL